MGEWLTALSILIAALTWLTTYLRGRRAKQVEHTVNIIANLSTGERLAESTFQVIRLINSKAAVPPEEIDPKIESHLVDILDYYEFLSELYFAGVLDKATVENLRGRLMKRTWHICERYIEETRNDQNRKVYSCFERFVRELPLEDQLPAACEQGPAVCADVPADSARSPGAS